jgi:drug/metabolite transporter (DMT)-like permease
MSNNLAASPPLNSPLYGIGLMIIMTACFSILDALAKYVCNELPLWMVMWGRYFFHFLFITVFFLRRAPRDIIFTKNLKLQILRSVLIFCAGVTFWSGLMYLPLADCTVITFIAPLLVTILSVILLGEKFGLHRWGSVIIGLFGVVFVIRPGMGIAHWAVILPLFSALFYATILITTRILGQRENVLTTLFYTSIGGLILSSIMVIFSWKAPSPIQWLLLMWLGLLGAIGHFFMIKAFEKAPASLLAPFNYASLIWATILGFFLFGDLPDGWTIFGATIIISSGLYIVKRESAVPVA